MCKIDYSLEELINHPKLSDDYKFQVLEERINEEIFLDWLETQELGIPLETLGLKLDDLNDFYDIDDTDYQYVEQKFVKGDKISFDYDETLTTPRGMELCKRKLGEGYIVYVISARQDKEPMLKRIDELGIPHDRVFATGSNKKKVEKIKELGIKKHYDNNKDVVDELGSVGEKFKVIRLYKYFGDISDNSRPFCRTLVRRTNLSLMRREDIEQLNTQNPGFGKGGSDTYSVFNWRGGANCVHKWVKYYYDEETMNLVLAPDQPQQTSVDGKVPYANGTLTPPSRKRG